jgi:hypothetical protein
MSEGRIQMGVSENAARSNTPTARENTAHMDDLKDLLETKIDAVAEVAFQRDLRYEERFKERDLRHEERFKERDLRYDERFKSNDARSAERFARMEEHTKTITEGSEKAITKAEISNEKRFDAVNEFRGALSDQQANLYPRSEALTQIKVYDQKLEEMRDDISSLREYRSSATATEQSTDHHTDADRGRYQFNINTLLAVVGIILSLVAIMYRLTQHL